jgi:hypothetical protein
LSIRLLNALKLTECFVEFTPRARGLSYFVMAGGEVKQRAELGIEALTVFELGTCLVCTVGGEKFLSFLEERLCDRTLRRRRLGASRPRKQ